MELGSFMDLGGFDDSGLFYEGTKIDEWALLDSPTASRSFFNNLKDSAAMLARPVVQALPAAGLAAAPIVQLPIASLPTQLAQPLPARSKRPQRTAQAKRKPAAAEVVEQEEEEEDEQQLSDEDDDLASQQGLDESGRPSKQRRLNKNPKNKLAADKYRRKKKEELIDLQENVKVMQRERTELDVRHSQLMQELEFLRQVIKSSPHMQAQVDTRTLAPTPSPASASSTSASTPSSDTASHASACNCGCHSGTEERLARMESTLASIAASLAARS